MMIGPEQWTDEDERNASTFRDLMYPDDGGAWSEIPEADRSYIRAQYRIARDFFQGQL